METYRAAPNLVTVGSKRQALYMKMWGRVFCW